MNSISKIAAVAVLFLALGYIAVPKLLSTDYVRERVTGQLIEMTGLPVRLNGGSSITLRPYLSVQYDDVTFGTNENPALEMDRLQVKLGLLSALFGNAKVSEVVLIRPAFSLIEEVDGSSNWSSSDGKLAKELRKDSNVAEEKIELGRMTIRDGIFRWIDRSTQRDHRVTSIDGVMAWSDTQSPFNGQINGVWRGENVAVVLSLADPLKAIKGGATEINLGLKSGPATINFSGEMDRGGERALGKFDGDAPSAQRLLQWIGAPLKASTILGRTAISGQLDMSRNSMDFSQTTLTVEQHVGTGRLQIKRQEADILDVSGTLAFDALSFTDFSLGKDDEAYSDDPIEISSLSGFNLDIRLSAPKAVLQNLETSNLAAAIIVRDGTASLDIGQAEAFGGTMTGSVDIKTALKKLNLSSRFNFKNIELSQLAGFYGSGPVVPVGVGDANLQFSSEGKSAREIIERLNGEGQIRSVNGSLVGIDFADIVANAKVNSQKIWQSLQGATSYSKLTLGFFVANGTAFLRGSSLENDALTVSLGGGTDLAERSLALRGEIASANGATLPFFVGGTTTSPLFVPLLDAAKAAPEKAAEENGEVVLPSQ